MRGYKKLIIHGEKLKVRYDPNVFLQMCDYDLESEIVASRLAGANQISHFLEVFLALLKANNSQEYFEILISELPPISQKPRFRYEYIAASSSPLFLALMAFEMDRYMHAVCLNPYTHPLTLSYLVKHPDAGIRMAVASNPNLPINDFTLLLEDWFVLYFGGILSNPRIPKEILRNFVKDHSEDIYALVEIASNPATPPDILSWLVRYPKPSLQPYLDIYERLLHQVASNHNIASKDLVYLARKNIVVSTPLLDNPRADPALLRYFLAHPTASSQAWFQAHPQALAASLPVTPP